MKNSSRRRPELEPLESMVLLTTIVPATFSDPSRVVIQSGGPIQLASTHKVQVVGMSVAPTSSIQTTHHATVVSFGPISTASLAKSPTVHTMIVPISTSVVTKPTTHAVVVAGPAIKVATQASVGHTASSVKVS